MAERPGAHLRNILPGERPLTQAGSQGRGTRGQPAPFALVDQHGPFAQVARHAPFGQSDCGMGTGREASSHAEVRVSGSHAGIRAPGAERRGPRARARAPGTALVEDTLARDRTHQEPAPAGARLPACSTRRIARAQKRRRSEERRLPRKTTGANQIRPES